MTLEPWSTCWPGRRGLAHDGAGRLARGLLAHDRAEPPPRSAATASSSSWPVTSGTTTCCGPAAHEQRHRGAAVDRPARAPGSERITMPVGDLGRALPLRPRARRSRALARAAWRRASVSPTTSGTLTVLGPFETNSVTVEPSSTLSPALGTWSKTMSAGRRSARRLTSTSKPCAVELDPRAVERLPDAPAARSPGSARAAARKHRARQRRQRRASRREPDERAAGPGARGGGGRVARWRPAAAAGGSGGPSAAAALRGTGAAAAASGDRDRRPGANTAVLSASTGPRSGATRPPRGRA